MQPEFSKSKDAEKFPFCRVIKAHVIYLGKTSKL